LGKQRRQEIGKGREELVILKQKLAAAESRLGMYKAAALQETNELKLKYGKTLDVAQHIFSKLVAAQVITTPFASWYMQQIRNGCVAAFPSGKHNIPREELEDWISMFTQQHYEALAKLLKETRQHFTTQDAIAQPLKHQIEEAAIGEFQLRLQSLLKRDNPKFKELLFIGAASEHAPPK